MSILLFGFWTPSTTSLPFSSLVMSVIGMSCGEIGVTLVNSLGGDAIAVATEGLMGYGVRDPIARFPKLGPSSLLVFPGLDCLTNCSNFSSAVIGMFDPLASLSLLGDLVCLGDLEFLWSDLFIGLDLSLISICDKFVGVTTVCPPWLTTFHDCGRLDPARSDLRSVRTLCELTVTMVFAPLVSVSAANANSGVSAGDPDVDIHYGQRIPIRVIVQLVLTGLGYVRLLRLITCQRQYHRYICYNKSVISTMQICDMMQDHSRFF